ncbi:MAG: hypothetical protein HY951_19145 [Bacteroidia bacterium]|nr:hypothetical protein [Bacteroidia bacterium]
MRFYLNIFVLIVFLFVTEIKFAFSQEFIQTEEQITDNKKSGFDKKRLFYGGGLGLQFGDRTLIDLSPKIGYRFTEKFSMGVGFTYVNYAYNKSPKFSTTMYGGNLFASYLVIENAFIYAEYELLSLESKYFSPFPTPEKDRLNIASILVGGGYKYQIGARSYLNMLVLWNLNQTEYSIYNNPVIRMNFEF